MGFEDETTSAPLYPRPERVHSDNYVLNELKRFEYASKDNFDRKVSNPLLDIVDVAGDKEFTPERLRFFKDGSRVFLQYGTDPTYEKVPRGHLLKPGSDQTVTFRTAQKAPYQVGYDLWPSFSYKVNGPLQSGDVVGGGYGPIDIGNFDPETLTYSGSEADGIFLFHTEDTGLSEAELVMVDSGTVLDTERVTRHQAASVLSLIEWRFNWYAVGPGIARESFTDQSTNPDSPQINRTLGAVANDDGGGPMSGTHRVTIAAYQAAGNSGLELKAGSIGVRAPGPALPEWKQKGHSMDLENTNTTPDTYQVCGAMRIDPERPNVLVRITGIEITATPGADTSRTRILFLNVGSTETNATGLTFSTPVEHSESNSVLREVEDNTITGPFLDAGPADSTGATLSNTGTNPGAYQLARQSVSVEGTGSKTSVTATGQTGTRDLLEGDVCLILVDSDTAGTVELDVATEQNS